VPDRYRINILTGIVKFQILFIPLRPILKLLTQNID